MVQVYRRSFHVFNLGPIDAYILKVIPEEFESLKILRDISDVVIQYQTNIAMTNIMLEKALV